MAVAADGHHGLIVDAAVSAAVSGRCGHPEFAAEALKLRPFLLEDVAQKWTKPRHFRVRSNCFFFGSLDLTVPPSRFGSAKQIELTQHLQYHVE